MKSGDRVLINAKTHPWYGQTGVLTDEVIIAKVRVIHLDNGMNCGAEIRDLQKL